jgi:hypothetical protein
MSVVIKRPFKVHKTVCNGCVGYTVHPYRVVYDGDEDITIYDSSISVTVDHSDWPDRNDSPDISVHLGGYRFTPEQLGAIAECMTIIREIAENPPVTYRADWQGGSPRKPQEARAD